MASGVNSPRSKLRLAIFDLDGTLTAVRSPYRFVSRALGLDTEAAQVFARFQRGEINYRDWGRHEVALWKGVPLGQFIRIIHSIPYRPGAKEFVHLLKATGVSIALISAAFQPHVERCAAELGADVSLFNRLGVFNDRLTGEFFSEIGGDNKGKLARGLLSRFDITREEALAAGDTQGDIPMFSEVAASIVVEPESPEVAQAADLLLPGGDWSRAWTLLEEFRPGWLPSRSVTL